MAAGSTRTGITGSWAGYDVVNISGHRIGTAEVESALVSYPKVSEAAVVGYPHDIKGQALYAYVTLKEGVAVSDDIKKELIQHVRKEIGPIAQPDKIQFSEGLPKTRSGKIMRRILRKIAENDTGNLGDTTTLADHSVVEDVVEVPQRRVVDALAPENLLAEVRGQRRYGPDEA